MKKLLLGLLTLTACSSNEPKKEVEVILPTYAQAVKYYQNTEYDKALSTIDKFIDTRPHSIKYKEALYLKGKTLKQLARADECIETFGKVIELSKGSKDSFFAYSLYYAGLCQELNNETAKAIAVYQDALKAKDITPELKNLELPARLAIAYSRIGEDSAAQKYYNQTKQELKKLKKSRLKVAEQREMLSEILMNMGTLTQSFSQTEDFENYLDSIKLSQEYLVLVFQMDMGNQSERALKLLVNHFDAAYTFILNLPTENAEDETLSLRNRQATQKKLAQVLLQNIEAFETYLTPESQSKDAHILEQLAKISATKKDLEKILDEKPIGQDITPEAQKLLNLKLPGKMRDQKSILEENATLPKKQEKK